MVDLLSIVRKYVGDRPEGEHDEAEGCIGRVEAVGPVDDQTDAAIEAFVLLVVDPESHRGQDAFLAFADRLGRSDEGLEPAALRLRAETVDQEADIFFAEVASEDGAQGFFERVGPPELTSLASELAQVGRLVVVEITGVLE